jgi:hypothetical protein
LAHQVCCNDDHFDFAAFFLAAATFFTGATFFLAAVAFFSTLLFALDADAFFLTAAPFFAATFFTVVAFLLAALALFATLLFALDADAFFLTAEHFFAATFFTVVAFLLAAVAFFATLLFAFDADAFFLTAVLFSALFCAVANLLVIDVLTVCARFSTRFPTVESLTMSAASVKPCWIRDPAAAAASSSVPSALPSAPAAWSSFSFIILMVLPHNCGEASTSSWLVERCCDSTEVLGDLIDQHR